MLKCWDLMVGKIREIKSRGGSNQKTLDSPLCTWQNYPKKNILVVLSNKEAPAIIVVKLSKTHQVLELAHVCYLGSEAAVTAQKWKALGITLRV